MVLAAVLLAQDVVGCGLARLLLKAVLYMPMAFGMFEAGSGVTGL